ncbi:MAG: TIGR03118 family protein [Geothrix sp.]|nr:TIGR03118 family protein [Geothrix sp.]
MSSTLSRATCPSRGAALRPLLPAAVPLLLLSLAACGGGGGGSSSSSMYTPPPTLAYQITKLVADQASAGATTTDASLVNPWGLAYGPTTDFWVANQATATTTVYDGLGRMPAPPIVVSVPSLTGSAEGGPTGVVFNGSATAFMGDKFIFASLDGSISGWSTGVATTRRVDNSASQAIYTGLAIGTSGTTTYLFAANLGAGTIDVFDSSYAPVHLGATALEDPTLPAGFSPYNVQVLGGKLYVTYAQHAASAPRETPGAGLGYVSLFNLDGSFVMRIASAGSLNAPWGLALAPANFGPYSSALLVGNFGDGRITAYNATTGASMGQLADASGAPLAISGLWGMTFGNDASAGISNQLYVTAGPQAQTHGLFATISYGPPGGNGGTGGGSGY